MGVEKSNMNEIWFSMKPLHRAYFSNMPRPLTPNSFQNITLSDLSMFKQCCGTRLETPKPHTNPKPRPSYHHSPIDELLFPKNVINECMNKHTYK